MNYGNPYDYADRRRKLDNPATRCLTGIVILAIHVLVIGATVFWGGGCRSADKPKEKMYKVKLGGSEPSHAPEVGPPERLRPTGNQSPTPPEPAVNPPPKPAPSEPAVKPKPNPVPKEPKAVKPKPRPKPKEPKAVKPKPKPAPKEPKAVKPKPTRNAADLRQKRNVREPAAKTPPQNRRNAKPRRDDGVYKPPGGSNFNPNVRIGTRDAGQKRGPADNRTPMAGNDDAAEKEWQNRVQRFVEMMWTPPENVFWGDNTPQAVLELVISYDGKVLSARLVKASGNPRMDGTIQQLIAQLKGGQAPRPPSGQQTIEVELIPK